MEMINFSKVKKEVIARFMLVMLLMAMIMPAVSGKLVSKNHATGSTTQDSTTQDSEIGDVDVSMGDDGTISVTGFGDGNSESTWNKIFKKYKVVIMGISGLGTLTFIIFFAISVLKLGASAENPQARSRALMGILVTGIAAALFGATTIILGLFWNALK